TGVMVLSPRHHRDVLERTYAEYEQHPGGPWNYEMRPLSYELLKAGCVHWLDPRFNYIWDTYRALHFPFLLDNPGHPRASRCLAGALGNVHFMHFAGCADQIADIRPKRPSRTRAASATEPRAPRTRRASWAQPMLASTAQAAGARPKVPRV